MEQSPSWGASSSSAIQEIPCLLWNPTVHQHIHMSLPFVPVLNPDSDMPSHSISVRSALILSFSLCFSFPSGQFPSGFPTKPYMQCPAHLILLDLVTLIVKETESRTQILYLATWYSTAWVIDSLITACVVILSHVRKVKGSCLMCYQ